MQIIRVRFKSSEENRQKGKEEGVRQRDGWLRRRKFIYVCVSMFMWSAQLKWELVMRA